MIARRLPFRTDPPHVWGFTSEQADILDLLPGSLCKAAGDSWSYLIGLRNGTLIKCSSISVESRERVAWLHLNNPRIIRPPIEPEDFILSRGLDVKLSDVILSADEDS